MPKYKRLSFDERETISRGLACGKSMNQIARDLDRHKSTISREINKKGMTRSNYRAGIAYRRAIRNAGKRKHGKYKLLANERLWDVIEGLLRKHWSPEQIVNRIKKEYVSDKTMNVSPETIYSYLYVYPKGELKKELLKHLRRNHKVRRTRTARKAHVEAYRPRDMVLIDERPKDVNDRAVPGHWEGDLIYGNRCQSALGTMVERKTRYLMLIRVKNKTAKEVRMSFAKKVSKLPTELRLSLNV